MRAESSSTGRSEEPALLFACHTMGFKDLGAEQHSFCPKRPRVTEHTGWAALASCRVGLWLFGNFAEPFKGTLVACELDPQPPAYSTYATQKLSAQKRYPMASCRRQLIVTTSSSQNPSCLKNEGPYLIPIRTVPKGAYSI